MSSNASSLSIVMFLVWATSRGNRAVTISGEQNFQKTSQTEEDGHKHLSTVLTGTLPKKGRGKQT